MKLLNLLNFYLHFDCLTLIAILYVIGEYLRNSVIKNEDIPYILTIFSCVSIFLNSLMLIESYSLDILLDIIISSCTKGMIVTALTVYINQLIKQYEKKRR